MAISIGGDCGGATYLRNIKKRDKSYPFDWLVTRSTKAVAATLMNDFEDFAIIKKEVPDGGTHLRSVNKDGFVFLNRGKLSNDKLKEEFDKKINSFKQAISDGNILLIRREYGAHMNKCESASGNSFKLLKEAILYLRKKNNNKNISCVALLVCEKCVNQYKNIDDEVLTIITDAGPRDKALLNIISKISFI